MTEKEILQCGDEMTVKCYRILKKIHGKKFALRNIIYAPFFKK